MQPSEAHKEYIRILLKDLRAANRVVYKQDQRWKRLNYEMKSYLDRSGITDIHQRNKIAGESIALADALNTGKWWREKAMWLSQVILAEQAALNLLGGNQWDTSPSQPSSSSGSARSWSEHL
jgi:hypothetical protein